MQIVALDHEYAAFELGQARHLGDTVDDLLSRQVGGVSLAGENEQHRPLGSDTISRSQSRFSNSSAARL